MYNPPKEIFNELNFLIKNNEAFYKKEFILDNKKYWIYNYRLASYTDFLSPSAIEARGIMFEIDNDNEFVKLASRSFPKFFNHNECPFTMNLDYSNFMYCVDKLDGSLISTFIHNNELRVKTKGSLFSDQAIASQKLLDTELVDLKKELTCYAHNEYTTCMEFTSNLNRIVIGYPKSNLTILAIRNNIDGSYIPRDELKSNPIISKYLVSDYNNMVNTIGVEKFINDIPDITEDIEGYIFMLANGQLVKHKTKKYVSLHQTKDSITTPSKLFEVCVNEGADDLKSMFHSDIGALNIINKMQEKVSKIYNHTCKIVDDFYNENKLLDRKSYAIKGQKELYTNIFHLAMLKYIGKDVNIKEWMIKNYQEFDIKDVTISGE